MECEEAAGALRDVELGRRRSTALRGYADAGSTIIVWGLVWLICNLATDFVPGGHRSWMIGIPLGILWSIAHPYIGKRVPRTGADWRIPLSVLAAFVFLALVMRVTGADGSHAEQNVLISLLVAVAYVLGGIWTGLRFALLGIALTLVICIGWFAYTETVLLWLGLGGGGALILGGIWLRQA